MEEKIGEKKGKLAFYTAKNTTFRGVMTSHALPEPFGHFITVYRTENGISICIFGNIF